MSPDYIAAQRPRAPLPSPTRPLQTRDARQPLPRPERTAVKAAAGQAPAGQKPSGGKIKSRPKLIKDPTIANRSSRYESPKAGYEMTLILTVFVIFLAAAMVFVVKIMGSAPKEANPQAFTAETQTGAQPVPANIVSSSSDFAGIGN